MKQVCCSPKSAILPSVISNFDNSLPIGSSDWHHSFFLLGMAVARLKRERKSERERRGKKEEIEERGKREN